MSCEYTHFPGGSCAMPGQHSQPTLTSMGHSQPTLTSMGHSQPTLTSMGHRCMCVLLLPAVCTFGKMLGSFTCYCPNTGVEWDKYQNKSVQKADLREENSPSDQTHSCLHFGFLLLWQHKAWNRHRNKSQYTKLTREEKFSRWSNSQSSAFSAFCYCGNTRHETDTEIRVSTESWLRRRKFSKGSSS